MAKITKKELMLQTVDNPYDPFTQFDEWYHFDTEEKQHYTYQYLDRIVELSPNMTPLERENAYDKAMKEIVSYNPELYRLVSKDVETDTFSETYDF